MARGPKPVALSLTPPERETLQALVRRRSTHQDVAMRARIVLACADPHATNTAMPNGLASAGRASSLGASVSWPTAWMA
jgi:hypothetical protein